MKRRSYKVNMILNDIFIDEIVIDPHYEAKHSESINDLLILEIFRSLNGAAFEEETSREDFSYYMAH